MKVREVRFWLAQRGDYQFFTSTWFSSWPVGPPLVAIIAFQAFGSFLLHREPFTITLHALPQLFGDFHQINGMPYLGSQVQW